MSDFRSQFIVGGGAFLFRAGSWNDDLIPALTPCDVAMFLCLTQLFKLIINICMQVWSCVRRNVLRPHHAVPAAGERRSGRHLPGG